MRVSQAGRSRIRMLLEILMEIRNAVLVDAATWPVAPEKPA